MKWLRILLNYSICYVIIIIASILLSGCCGSKKELSEILRRNSCRNTSDLSVPSSFADTAL